MKTVRKLKDFSIESILQDRFMLLDNDHYKNQSQSAVIQSCNVHFPVGDDREKCLQSNVRISVESAVEDIRNKLKFEKENPASCTNTDFEVSMDDTCRVNNLDRNKDEVHAKTEDSKQSSQRQQYKDMVNRYENNINRTYKNSNAKCITDALPTRERINKPRYNKFVNSLTEYKFNLTEIAATKDEHKCDEISVNHKSLNLRSESKTTEYRNDVNSLEEDRYNCLREEQRKQLEEGREFFGLQMKGINSYHSEQRGDEDLNSELHRKLEEREANCSLNETQQQELVKSCKDKSISLQVIPNTTKLEWLKCTRYRPPKVPRKSVIGKNRRKPSIHPRIPFTAFQVDCLEQKFRNRAYLSKDDVLDTSNMLHLSSNRVQSQFYKFFLHFNFNFFEVSLVNTGWSKNPGNIGKWGLAGVILNNFVLDQNIV